LSWLVAILLSPQLNSFNCPPKTLAMLNHIQFHF
jgi:hypothetical protein